jgi:hypothetical protein
MRSLDHFIPEANTIGLIFKIQSNLAVIAGKLYKLVNGAEITAMVDLLGPQNIARRGRQDKKIRFSLVVLEKHKSALSVNFPFSVCVENYLTFCGFIKEKQNNIVSICFKTVTNYNIQTLLGNS